MSDQSFHGKQIRILHIIAGMGSGGAEHIIMEWYRRIDRTKYQFDFLIRSNENIYMDEIRSLGGHVYCAPRFPQECIENYKYTKALLEKKKYRIIHVHANALIYIYPLIEAKKNEIPCRIMHSHNTNTASPLFFPIHQMNKCRIKQLANVRLACSNAAGKWMFGAQGGHIFVPNGIEIKKFLFQKKLRDEYREKLKIEDKFVVGNVARFLPSKNHEFLLKIFWEIASLEPDAVLLLAGEGAEQEKVINRAKKMGIYHKIRFLGVRDDIYALMQAMDVFVFPSKFEGLGIVLLEAQCSGLQCFASDCIPPESKISQNIHYVSLDAAPAVWARKILRCKNVKRTQEYLSQLSFDYDISNTVGILEKIYGQWGK